TVLTDFLISLGVDEETAREDACKMEHDISEKTFKALCRFAEKMKEEK
ncbi:MAG: metal-dependent transcriptional regulator, partial [Oscillospiraceae bacterium]|nr:metal-dependent transcriptional regulator [Oscillospiraceae bacterium]